ncbi:MAG: N-acetylmuramoyl-L-alanine amidase [Anaerolineales bacterium]|nr:N-acetylmuramoyl-L-alanine amidase [Anaerolineales bacterium]
MRGRTLLEEQNAHQPEPRKRGNSSPRVMPAVLGVAFLMATLFTAWTPAGLFSGNLSEKLTIILTAQPESNPTISASYPQLHIGIVSGHWGYDSGAVCLDGNGEVTLTEADLNLRIATLVQQKLNQSGFQVDLLQEFDPRLDGYNAVALVSIHNDSCAYVDENATGFKLSAAMDTRDVNRATRLTGCLRDRYGRTTKLPFHPGSITSDMREYHAFTEISDTTIAAIIEAGFMNLDRELLTQHPEVIAEGIVQGIECFVNNESVDPTPVPTYSP